LEPDFHLVTFDRPGSSANIFDAATLLELEHLADEWRHLPASAKILFVSAKPKIFLAGADLAALQKTEDAGGIEEFIGLGQHVFEKIAGLRCLTVAAIHGACLGGGLEFALACSCRIASPDKETKLGLPETKLGILPAWGGTTRLPRLIGTPRALAFILGGKPVPAPRALSLGIIGKIVYQEHFVDFVRRLGRPAPHPLPVLRHNRLLTGIAAAVARRRILRETHGCYPAPLAVADIIRTTAHGPVERGLKAEKQAVLELARGPVSRNLIRLFLLGEEAKKQAADRSAAPVRRTAVVGAGVMGSGIAYWLSSRRLPVFWSDLAAGPLAKGLENLRKEYAAAVRARILDRVEAARGFDRLHPLPGQAQARNMDLVIEAAVERMDLKKEIFRDLDRRSAPSTLLATNTSALSITRLAEGLEHPERVLGLHFFNPVSRMPLVEVIAGDATSPEAVARAVRFVIAIGKTPVVAADRPGFIVNRILVPYMLEAARMLEEGESPEDIDATMLRFGMPMGPIRLADEVGLDIALHVAGTLAEAFPDRVAVPENLRQAVGEGRLGRKNGRGFYDYPDKRAARSAGKGRASEEIEERLVFLMVNEAVRCLEEKVASHAKWIDLAMVLGTGFAPWTGGPLRRCDATGPVHWMEIGHHWEAEYGSRYTPAALLQHQAKEGGLFHENAGNP
jgi:3-hydroxyacyl-CoA dehydrogenase/enoyl-CoA hydratase/3-hydroxybutyryl-CoA epimerase